MMNDLLGGPQGFGKGGMVPWVNVPSSPSPLYVCALFFFALGHVNEIQT